MRIVVSAVFAVLVAVTPMHAQRPWLSADMRIEYDNQLRSAQHIDVGYGGYLHPALTLAVRLAGDHIRGELPVAGTAEITTAAAGLTTTLAIPSARVGLQLGGYALFRESRTDAEKSVQPLYDATARWTVASATALRIRAAREHYTATLASLDTLMLMRTVEISLDRAAAPGWAGEVVARRSDFGDDNPIETAFAWLLVPLSRSANHSLRVGYAAAWQDSEHSNWLPSGSAAGTASQQVPGRYAPYYTPHDVLTHTVLINGAQALGRVWLMVNGAFGVRATETTPVLIRPSASAQNPPELQFHERSFTPVRAQLSLIVPADARTSVTIVGGYDRSAYYRTGSVRLAVARHL